MELIWVALLVTRVFVMALLRAAVPIVLGLGSAAIAGGFFAGFLRHDSLGGFFSSASGVSVGMLLALIVNGVVRVRNDMVDQIVTVQVPARVS